MPKKKKCGKNTKNKGSNVEQRKLVEADTDGQLYGFVEKALGDKYFTVNCVDNVIRRCRVRTKRMRINAGDCIIVALRDYDDGNADIIYKYKSDEVRSLQKMGLIPDSNAIGGAFKENQMIQEEEEDVFVFENI
jgi:translation initiation factor 1A